jgi:hypothetical protein
MVSGKHIFIAALDWGQGHATRCIPLIKRLEKNNRLTIGVTPETKTIFHEYFPNMPTLDLPPYAIRYAKYMPAWVKILLDWPRINRVMKREHQQLRKLIDTYKFNVIISDSRFGLYSPDVHSVLLTHQLHIQTPVLNFFVQAVNKKMLAHFHEIWVPDYAETEKSLSGKLSHGKAVHPHISFIGPLSRFEHRPARTNTCDYLVVLSGPEPLHSKFAAQMIEVANRMWDKKFVFVSHVLQINSRKNIQFEYQPDVEKMMTLVASSDAVICRGGYSTLMDLHAMEKNNIYLCPTPGQTEQKYLAKYWKKKFGAKIITLGRQTVFMD